MKINTFIYACILIIAFACSPKLNTQLSKKKAELNTKDKLEDRYEKMLNYTVDSLSFPRSGHEGEVKKVPSKDWTSGFFPGSLFYAYRLTDDERFLKRALAWLPFVEKEKHNAKTHDMGFKVFCSYGNALKIGGDNDRYKDIIVHSARTLSKRYDPTVGSIKSWDFGKNRWTFPVIIDNMMNLELLFEATRLSGDSTFHNIAVNHANTTLNNHFRKDNSSYHVIDYNPDTGEVLNKLTHQGHHESSAWARGQAWGLYGFTMSFRYTNNTDFLMQAEKIASFIMNHPSLPKDKIPYWDYDYPEIPDTYRDASAAAITASALIELSEFTGKDEYLSFAKDIVSSLDSPAYILASGDIPFILDHSTGDWSKQGELDHSISYADYYFLEAKYRLKNLN